MSAAVAGIAISTALDLVISLMEHASEIQQLIATAQAEGRTSLTVEEWAGIVGQDDAALASLAAAIKAKQPLDARGVDADGTEVVASETFKDWLNRQ